jgi:hypothetical protein
MATGKEGEFVSVGRNMAGPFSSLELAQEEAKKNAIETCEKMGKKYKKLYAIDRPMAIAQAPESTLYFICVDPNNGDTSEVSKTAIATTQSIPASADNMSNYTIEMKALITVLEKKGLLTRIEISDEILRLKKQ